MLKDDPPAVQRAALQPDVLGCPVCGGGGGGPHQRAEPAAACGATRRQRDSMCCPRCVTMMPPSDPEGPRATLPASKTKYSGDTAYGCATLLLEEPHLSSRWFPSLGGA